jgi:hypothetical protein
MRSPDSPMPAASASPPPNIMITPHGAVRLFPVEQRARRPSGSRTAQRAKIAIDPSVTVSPGNSGQERKRTQPATTRDQRHHRFSACDQRRSPRCRRAARDRIAAPRTCCTRIRISSKRMETAPRMPNLAQVRNRSATPVSGR